MSDLASACPVCCADRAPTSDPSQAGVFVHQLNVFNGRLEGGWLPNPVRPELSDRFSATLIHAEAMHIYDPSLDGLILRPAAMNVLCSYPYDGGTLHRTCNPPGLSPRCTPGCGRFETINELPTWCARGNWQWCSWPGAFRPEALDDMMRAHTVFLAKDKPWNDCGHRETGEVQDPDCYYNEVVCDASAWSTNMPHTVEAVFHLASQPPDVARAVRDRYAELHGQRVPVLRLDLANSHSPFSLDSR